MKLNIFFKIAIGYIVLMAILWIYVTTNTGDTPIIPALIMLLPWGIAFAEKFRSLSNFETLTPIINTLLNIGILVLIGLFSSRSRPKEL